MIRHFIGLLLIFVAAGITLNRSASSAPPEGDTLHYLPLVFKADEPPIVEIVGLNYWESFGYYPTYYKVYGYVNNLTDDPVYSVELEVDYTICSEFDPCYSGTYTISTVLPATLPGQLNPFSHESTLGHASIHYGEVRIKSFSLNGNGVSYAPLTVVNWEYANSILSGTIRNDTEHTLTDLALVITKLDYPCGFTSIEPDVSTLGAGQQATFSKGISEYCMSDTPAIFGQGISQP